MTFSRSFKTQTWFVHTPDGSVEVMDGRLLERGFESRLLDGQTPVRAVESSVWTTLAEAGGLGTLEGVPGADRFDASRLDVTAWRRGADIDARKLDGRRGKSAAMVALALVAGTVFLFSTHLSSAEESPRQARTGELLPRPHALLENDARPARPVSRLSYELQLKILQGDQWRDLGAEKERVRRAMAKKSPLTGD